MIKIENNRFYEKYDYLGEMARVGIFNNIEVFVRTNDPGKVPHFHFIDRNKRKDNEGCIKIDKPEYFDHANKKLHLNSNQKKELVNFLSQPFNKKRFTGTNWEYLVDLWNINNSDVEVNEDIEMPDYTKLP